MTLPKTGIITTEEHIAELSNALSDKVEIAFDTETDGLSHDREMIGLSIAFKTESRYEGFYIPVRHEASDDLFAVPPDNAPIGLVINLMREVLGRPGVTVWIHNAKFDLKVLRNEGLDLSLVKATIGDTQCASWLLDPDRQGGHGLKSLVKTKLGFQMGEFKQFASYSRNCEVPVGMMAKYAIADAVWLLRLAHDLVPTMSPQQLKILFELEMPMMSIVEEMEHYGFKIDVSRLKEAGLLMSREAQIIEKEFKDRFGPMSSITSTQWLSQNLCGSMWGTFGLRQTTRGCAVDKDSLEAWSKGEVVGTTKEGSYWADKVTRHRALSKLVSTYTSKLVEKSDKQGRVHGSFNQWGTATGRMSSRDPNMQNIPSSRSEEGDFIRKSFVAEDGYKLVVADYSQVELRITAHLSRDATMMRIYNENGDIHQMTADACGCARFDAKAINFGLIYKMGSKTLANKINKNPREAQAYIDRYFAKYMGVASWQSAVVAAVRSKGFTWTLIGRRRYLPNINSSDMMLRKEAERIAINTQVQGSASDIMKIAMRNYKRSLESRGIGPQEVRIIGQVHDEVIVEAKVGLEDLASDLLKGCMEQAAELRVPLIAEPQIADSWGEAK
jgi:DNA polymerase-1